MERMDQQFDFCREIDKEKLIQRQNYLTNGERKENDAEHAWHMSVMAVILSEYANEEIDVLKVITMILIHDIVEIDAGDTYAYDEEGKATQRERELKAADRLFGILPEDQRKKFRGLWDEFEAAETPEAKFARTLDHIQPLMLNAASEGRSWREHDIHLAQVLARNEKTAEGSEKIWDYVLQNLIRPSVKKGNLKE